MDHGRSGGGRRRIVGWLTMSTKPVIPTTADHLTAQWLNDAFDGSIAEIAGVRAERLGEGVVCSAKSLGFIWTTHRIPAGRDRRP